MVQFCLLDLNYFIFAVWLEAILIVFYFPISQQKILFLFNCSHSLKFLFIFFFLDSPKSFLNQKTYWSYESLIFWYLIHKAFYYIPNWIFFWNLDLYQSKNLLDYLSHYHHKLWFYSFYWIMHSQVISHHWL